MEHPHSGPLYSSIKYEELWTNMWLFSENIAKWKSEMQKSLQNMVPLV